MFYLLAVDKSKVIRRAEELIFGGEVDEALEIGEEVKCMHKGKEMACVILEKSESLQYLTDKQEEEIGSHPINVIEDDEKSRRTAKPPKKYSPSAYDNGTRKKKLTGKQPKASEKAKKAKRVVPDSSGESSPEKSKVTEKANKPKQADPDSSGESSSEVSSGSCTDDEILAELEKMLHLKKEIYSTKNALQEVQIAKTPSIAVRKLMSGVFTPDALKTCTLSGDNKKGKEGDVEQLHSVAVDVILDFVLAKQTYYNGLKDQKQNQWKTVQATREQLKTTMRTVLSEQKCKKESLAKIASKDKNANNDGKE